MKKNKAQPIYFFNDPRLKMTVAGRFVVRVGGYVGYLVVVAAGFTLLISSVSGFQYLGVVIFLFLVNRLIHRRWADRQLIELPSSGKINLARYLKPLAFSVLEKSFNRSSIFKEGFLLEVFRQLLDLKEIKESLRRMDLDPGEIIQKVDELSSRDDNVSSSGIEHNDSSGTRKKEKIKEVERLVVDAFYHALASSHQFINSSDLFSSLHGLNDKLIDRIFTVFSVEKEDLEMASLFSSLRDEFSKMRHLPTALGGFAKIGGKKIRHRIMNRAWTSRPTPILDKYSVDLTDLARQEKVGFLIGHSEEYQRLVDTLARPINPNALLIGEVGVGKETMISHLAYKLIKDKVPSPLFDKRLVSIQLSSLVAGATPEELQKRLEAIVDEIIIAGNVILCIPEIHNLVKTSGTAYLSAADALIPIIMNNAFPIIGTTYPREFKEYLEERSDFVGVFETIQTNEISEREAEIILIYQSLILESQTGVMISFGAVKTSVRLAKKYFRNKFLPSSADELLKSALVEAKRLEEGLVDPDMVIQVAEEKVNIPIREADTEEAERLLHLEDIIHERLVDQNEAVKSVSNVLREYRSGLSRPGGPIASFLFVGPTGVGKTELSKILADIQFGSKEMMIRFDMTEYQDKQSFYRFIGSPDGQISGALTDAVSKKPYSLILLDEFEKAFPDILDLFLQVFDDGRLTDNLGRTVSFENTIIIATSNAHSDIINEALNAGKTMSEIGDYLKRKLVDVFRPELLNRFSKVVVFNDLTPEDIRKIAALNLGDFAETVREQGIEILFSPEVIKRIAHLGYDPAFGARPLRRAIADNLRSSLAEKILSREVKKGDRVRIKVEDSQFNFIVEE